MNRAIHLEPAFVTVYSAATPTGVHLLVEHGQPKLLDLLGIPLDDVAVTDRNHATEGRIPAIHATDQQQLALHLDEGEQPVARPTPLGAVRHVPLGAQPWEYLLDASIADVFAHAEVQRRIFVLLAQLCQVAEEADDVVPLQLEGRQTRIAPEVGQRVEAADVDAVVEAVASHLLQVLPRQVLLVEGERQDDLNVVAGAFTPGADVLHGLADDPARRHPMERDGRLRRIVRRDGDGPVAELPATIETIFPARLRQDATRGPSREAVVFHPEGRATLIGAQRLIGEAVSEDVANVVPLPVQGANDSHSLFARHLVGFHVEEVAVLAVRLTRLLPHRVSGVEVDGDLLRRKLAERAAQIDRGEAANGFVSHWVSS